MYFVPNELIHQFEDFSIIIHIMFKDLITVLVSNNNQGTLIIYDFKTELVMPRKVAGFRLIRYNFCILSCVLNFIN